jgi:hypothetical protein
MPIAFGVNPACGGCRNPYAPDWLFSELNCTYTLSNGNKVPVWDDPIFMEQQAIFIKMLSDKFDGSRRVAYLDALSYGNWGEWHTGGLDGSKALNSLMQKKYVDMWSVFQEKTIMIPNNNKHDINGTIRSGPTMQGRYGSDKYGFGVRRDSSEVQPYDCDRTNSQRHWPAVPRQC